MNIGWIGIGVLGEAIVKNLLKKNKKISIYNRTTEKAEKLISLGASVVQKVDDLFLYSEIIFVCLGNQEAFENVVLSNDSILRKKRRLILVDLSTISPQHALYAYNKLKSYDISYIESPVSGGKEGAESGEMTAICAGDMNSFVKIKTILSFFCSHIHYVGEIGNAQKLKIINNLAESINLVCASEVVTLGLKLGLDIGSINNVLKTARGKSTYMDLLLRRLQNNDDNVEVSLKIRIKDLELAEMLLKEAGITRTVLSQLVIDFFKTTQKNYGELEDQTKCFQSVQSLLNE